MALRKAAIKKDTAKNAAATKASRAGASSSRPPSATDEKQVPTASKLKKVAAPSQTAAKTTKAKPKPKVAQPPLDDSDPRTLQRLDQLTIFSLYNNDAIGKANISAVVRHLSASFPALLFAFIEFDHRDREEEDDWAVVCRLLSVDRTREELLVLKNIFLPGLQW